MLLLTSNTQSMTLKFHTASEMLALINVAAKDAKQSYPDTIIAVEYCNALYFVNTDAELVAMLFRQRIDVVQGQQFCIVEKRKQNELAQCLADNKLMFGVIKAEQEAQPYEVFIVNFLETVVKPYNAAILRSINK